MKKIRLISILILLAACGKQDFKGADTVADITVLHDLTDTFVLAPQVMPILSLYDFVGNKNKAALFRYVLITDKQLNPVHEITIDDGSCTEEMNTGDELYHRELLVQAYMRHVQQSMNEFAVAYPVTPLSHSECYATIAHELELMSKRPSTQKTLIVFSDLNENTDAFSFYRAKDSVLLRTDPQKVTKVLNKYRPLPNDLRGVVVYFVYSPEDREADKAFRKWIAVYKRMLEPRGARIIVQAQADRYRT